MIGTERNNTNSKTKIFFLIKLHRILNDGDYSNYIQWSQDGLSFIIYNQNSFSKNVLPAFFNHNNYSSFVRQLNMYNFKKMKSKKDVQKYFHEQFHKWTTEKEIQLIKKKKKTDEDIVIPIEDINILNKKKNKKEENNIDNNNSIEELDEESKLNNYEDILKKGELSNNLNNINNINNIILLDLLNKSKKEIEKQKIVENDINNLIAQNKKLMKQLELTNNQLIMEKDNSKKMKGMILYLMKKVYNIKKSENKQKLTNFVNKYKIYKDNNKIEQLQNIGNNYSIMNKNTININNSIMTINNNPDEINPNFVSEIDNSFYVYDNDHTIYVEKSIPNPYPFNNLKSSINSMNGKNIKSSWNNNNNNNKNKNNLFNSCISNISLFSK